MASQPTDFAAFFNATADRYEDISAGCTQDLARSVVSIQALESMYSEDALVLDNAAGTAFVTEEIYRLARATNRPMPRVDVADAAPAMIALAERKLADLGIADSCSTQVMPGEKLEFPDGCHTHSITNLGVMFFTDGNKGIEEVFRTVKPAGGIGVVTCWEGRGFLTIIRESQVDARPDSPPTDVAFDKKWLEPSYLKNAMKDAGFTNVRLETHLAHFGMATREKLQEMLTQRFLPSSKNWSKSEQAVFKAALSERIEREAEPYTMLDGLPGFGLPMTGAVAIGVRN